MILQINLSEHPEIIQIGEPVTVQPNNSDQSTNEDENEDEDEEQEKQNTEPSLFPSEPIAFIFVMMIMMLQGRHLSDECAEIVMLFLNMALTHLELDYRFPKKLATFITRMDYQGRFYSGITIYVSYE
ncbi:hypothetical protein G6F56_012806 [Rhizopus delemar]|nr:hypothetical protein G6F56_012806 [Rhizopus delemar]